ncbi:MAG: TrmH family RNA methyltransferase [Runella sp.]
MLSKNTIKYLHSLQLKKNRVACGAFLVEGAKSVLEALTSDFEVEMVAMTEAFGQVNGHLFKRPDFRIEIATAEELAKAGTLQTNDTALAVLKTKPNEFLEATSDEYVLVLDDIRDPGNLGTIIRIADWYGLSKIVCSHTTTDWYNPKVIAASKGSFVRVRGFYTDLEVYFEQIQKISTSVNVYGTFLEGTSIYQTVFSTSGYIVLGNESHGISEATAKWVSQKITIPRFGEAESLNVGIATAIVLDNWRRGQL